MVDSQWPKLSDVSYLYFFWTSLFLLLDATYWSWQRHWIGFEVITFERSAVNRGWGAQGWAGEKVTAFVLFCDSLFLFPSCVGGNISGHSVLTDWVIPLRWLTRLWLFFLISAILNPFATSAAKMWLPVRGLFLHMGHLQCDRSTRAAFTPNWMPHQWKKIPPERNSSYIAAAVVDVL